MAVIRTSGAEAAAVEALRREAAEQGAHLRELEDENERLRERLAAGPDPQLVEVRERIERAEDEIARMESHSRRVEVAREHGIPAHLLTRVPDGELQDFAEGVRRHIDAERERVEAEIVRRPPARNGWAARPR